jgi:hypothetical protein
MKNEKNREKETGNSIYISLFTLKEECLCFIFFLIVGRRDLALSFNITDLQVVLFLLSFISKMSLSINQLCDDFKMQTTTAITTDQVKTFCDNIVAQLNRNKETNDVALLSMIVANFNLIDKAQFNDSSVLGHSLFVLLRDALASFLHTGENNSAIQQLCRDISRLVSGMTIKFVSLYVDIFKQLLIHKPLLDEVSVRVQKCAQNIANVPEDDIEVLNNLLFTYECLIRSRIEIQNNTLITTLLEAVAQCFASPHYGALLHQIGEQSQLNIRQEFFFERCPLFLHQCRSQQRKPLLTEVRKVLLPLFNQRLPFKQINKGETVALGSICAVLFIRAYDMMNSEKFRGEYDKLLRHLLTMLSTTNQIPQKNDSTWTDLIGEIVEQLSNFIFTEYFVAQMRICDLSSLLLKIIETINDEAVQFQAYRILAAILTEKDIKTLASPEKIVTIFLKPINDIINNVHCREPLDNVLIALKSELVSCFFHQTVTS